MPSIGKLDFVPDGCPAGDGVAFMVETSSIQGPWRRSAASHVGRVKGVGHENELVIRRRFGRLDLPSVGGPSVTIRRSSPTIRRRKLC